jgi:hypothetical protein
VNQKKNKRKVRDHSVPKEKMKLTKCEKSDCQVGMSNDKSVSISTNSKSNSNKLISKHVESRVGNGSSNVVLLKAVSDPKIVNQKDLRAECKKNGIGKGCVKKESVSVVKKKVNQIKHQVKQQWVSKFVECVSSNVQSESDPMVSSGEPIQGWVPKMN